MMGYYERKEFYHMQESDFYFEDTPYQGQGICICNE